MSHSVKTERFYIRELTSEDAKQHYLDWFQQEEIKRYIMHVPSSLDELTGYILDNQADSTAYLFGIFPHNSTQHIGNIRYEFAYNGNDKVDMGILLGDQQWRGKGVAAEAINAVSNYFFKQFGTREIILGVDSANVAAVKVYEKIGFKEKEKILIEAPEKIGLLMVWDLLE